MGKIHPLLCIVAIIIAGLSVLGALFSGWLIAAASVAMLAVLLFSIKNSHESFRRLHAEHTRLISILSSKIDVFTAKLEAARIDLTRHMYGLQSRASEREQETERNMREIAGKLLQVENSIGEVRRRLRYEEI